MFVHYDYQTDEPENIDREVSETISTPQGPLEIAEEKESVLAGLEEVAEILDGVFDIQLAAHEPPQRREYRTHVRDEVGKRNRD